MIIIHHIYKLRNLKKIIPDITNKIRKDGPLSSIDLDYNETIEWSWAKTRIARAVLESLFWTGILFIHHRIGTRKYYDLIENHKNYDVIRNLKQFKSEEEYYEWHIERRIGSIGLFWNKASDGWIGIRKINRNIRDTCFKKLIKAGKLHTMSVRESDLQLFIRHDDLKYIENIDKISKLFREEPKASIIAPLDNLLWDRKLIKALFDFDYVWEVYKPEKLRSYGYYVLPVLYGDRFIARFDASVNKKNSVMTLKNWWWEKGTTITSDIKTAINECFAAFYKFCNVKNIVIGKSKSGKNEMYAALKSILKIL